MSNSSPLVPQGSLLEQQSKGRPHLRIALCIVAVHLVFLGGLLIQGCKRDETPESAAIQEFAAFEPTNGPVFEIEMAPSNAAPVTELPPFFPEELGLGSAETSGVASMPAAVAAAPPVQTNVTPPPSVSRVTPPPVAPPGSARAGMQEYTVVAGDYFIKIAKKFNVTAAAIAQANPGVDSTNLQIGQKLLIPTAGSAAGGTPPPTTAGSGYYEVKGGDTLTKIAREHNTTVAAIKAANNLPTDQILVGQKLKLPSAAR